MELPKDMATLDHRAMESRAEALFAMDLLSKFFSGISNPYDTTTVFSFFSGEGGFR